MDAEEPAQKGGEDEQQDEEARGLVVEEEADGEEVGVAGGEAPAAGDDEGESGIGQQEEDPEVNLGEEQRMGAVEAQQLAQICEDVGRGGVISIFNFQLSTPSALRRQGGCRGGGSRRR